MHTLRTIITNPFDLPWRDYKESTRKILTLYLQTDLCLPPLDTSFLLNQLQRLKVLKKPLPVHNTQLLQQLVHLC